MSVVSSAPRFTLDEAGAVVRSRWGIVGLASELASERDQNLRFAAADGRQLVLKIANPLEQRSFLDAENAALRHLAPTGLCPVPLPALDGEDITSHDGHLVRLVTCLPGRTLHATALRSDTLLHSIGAAVGRIDASLGSFDHPAAHRELHWDVARARTEITSRIGRVSDPAMRRLVELVVDRRSAIEPTLAHLRRSVIHNDANDHNLLVDVRRDGSDRVVGVVDFGDMVHTHTVNGLAVAMAYAVLGQPDPILAAAAVVRGYHRELPLTEDELSVLFSCMCSRLALSVCVAAEQTAARPDDPYLAVSQAPIADVLPKLSNVHPRLAEYVFRDACGLEPVPASSKVVRWLRGNSGRFAHLVGRDLATAPLCGLDMSAGSVLVASDPADNSTERFTQRVFDRMAAAGADIGVGGYGEARVIYQSDPADVGDVPESERIAARFAERRTIHVGLDVTMAAGSPLFAPLDGVVHAVEEVAARHDYGPMIVLRHDVVLDDERLTFFTLYGHLSRESIAGVEAGRPVGRGERFASIGAAPSNGDWWPHVHVQVITDMLDVPCNYNGVATASQAPVWMSLCPDPNLLLGVPEEVFDRPPHPDDVAARRSERTGHNLSVSYGRRPLHAVRGWMQHLYDHTGRSYLDAYNNVAHVGHSHPRVVRAVREQLGVLNTNTRYLQRQLTDYTELLTAQLPSPLDVCFLTASGSEANELALRLARAATGRRDVLVMDSAYHGHTTSLIDISPYKHDGPGGSGAPDWVHTSAIPDAYRAGISLEDAGAHFAQGVGSLIDRCVAEARPPGAYIAETCPSVGGQLLLPDGYLAEVYRLVRQAGGMCIADEVQTGFGRIGTHFWAFEQHGVVPDIVVLGKPIANGYPMGAVVTSREVAESFDNGMEFFSTFGGSTVACVAAAATLQTVLDEGLQAHALVVGSRLLAGMAALRAVHELIGDVRGSGLFLGVELVRDRSTREPAPSEAAWVVDRMRMLGVLAGTDGPHHNVVKLRGPMPLTLDDAEVILHALDQALTELPPA